MEASKEEARTEKTQQASEEFVSNRKDSMNKDFLKSEVHEIRRYEMLALLIIFGLVLSAMWGGLSMLGGIPLRMGIHLNDRERSLDMMEERVNLMEEAGCRTEDCHVPATSTTRVSRRVYRASSQNPRNRKLGLYRASKSVFDGEYE